uniref:Flap endonuclease GEN 1 n=1 Tax=Echinococcus granulosus TaxID=6210 RepID=A0A068WAE3_ECHGR|nr:flap endonuclease GEN 1 [Echinococcus granulosus]
MLRKISLVELSLPNPIENWEVLLTPKGMGVHGLWNILNPVQDHIPLRSLGGQKLAIDLSGWVCGDICVNQRVQTGCRLYLRNLVFRLIALLREAILPIAVTDGIAPAVKAAALKERRQVSRLGNLPDGIRPALLKRSQFSRISFKCSQLLEALGVPCIASPGEAEAMCAFLNMENLVDACVTEDGDAFLYGATLVYRHFSLDARVESRLSLCRRSLVLLGLVLGCDYWLPGVPGVGPISACKLLTQVDVGEALRRLTGAGFDTTASSSEAAVVADSSVWRSPTWKKIILGLAGCSVAEVVDEFLVPWQARGWEMPAEASLVWSRPNVRQAVELCVDFLGWQPAYALAQFTPLLALWITRSTSSSPLCADIMRPLRIIRRRSVNYLPYLEVEWSRLKEDIWSELLVASDGSNGDLTTFLKRFFTAAGYRFPVPEAEFRLAFPHLVLAFESLSLRVITSKMDALSVNGRRGRSKQKKKSNVNVIESTKSDPQNPLVQQTSEKIIAAPLVLPAWDSSPEGSPLHLVRPTPSPPPVDTGQSLPPLPPVDNFISLRTSNQFECRLTLQSSLLAATPPHSPSTEEFDGFRTPARLADRLV